MLWFNFQNNFYYKFKTFTNHAWPGWSTIIIWIIGLILLTYETLINVLPILYDYQNHNVATQIAVIKNETIRPQNLTACIPYYSASLLTIASWILYDRGYRNETPIDRCLECEAMANRSWDIWTDMDFDQFRDFEKKEAISAISNQIASGLMERLLEDEQSLDLLKINRTNFNWNQPLVDAVWMFLSCTSRRDLSFTNTNVPGLVWDCFGFNFTRIGHLDNNLIDRLFDSMLDAVQIYLKSGAESLLPDIYEFVSLGDLSLRNRTIVAIKGSYLCFPLLDNASHEVFQYTPFNEEILPPWHRFVRQAAFSVFYDPSVLYGAVDLSDALYDTEGSTGEEVDKLTVNNENVAVTYTVNTKVVEGRQAYKNTCSKESSPAVCVAKRLAETAIDYCNCLPFTFRKLISNRDINNLTYCNDFFYASCYDILRKSLSRFTAECNDKCEYVFYRWKQTFSFPSDDSATKALVYNLNINCIKAPFVEFTLAIRDTPEKFLSQIGGLVNLYLGISGLTVCIVVVFFVDIIKHRFLFRKKGKGQEDIIISKIKLCRLANINPKISQGSNNNDLNEKIEGILDKILKWREEDNEKMIKMQKRLDNIFDRNVKIDKLLREKNILI